ncbi:aminoglycoside phosphotransferase family protein [Palleronia sp. LCG004]|uniref:aminoglycoside phosphotransferase family protein n=1 Tax=Palleronia sp. LCG004 TaxID=3079304 RepID=UPI002942901E|nr:phosphotransferase [Palleronia sp. LCG004]WOI55923.1 phosphotransferase [Palleronia sp. LCG004]
MSDRAELTDAFLSDAGWGGATRIPLAGDASSRRYERLRRGADRAILMDAPPDICGSQDAFVRMSRHLRGIGLAAPDCLAADPGSGLYLLEDLGEGMAAHVAEQGDEFAIYAAATDALVRMQEAPCPDWVRPYGPAEMVAAIAPARIAFGGEGHRPDWDAVEEILCALLETHDMPAVLIHRDYHAENLVWRPEREGLSRIGILDFQDALAGHPAYDLASLLQDARRDVGRDLEEAMIRRFADARGIAEGPFRIAYAVQAVQRHLRILGIFARLATEAGKPGYLRFVPRVRRDLDRDMSHPQLATLRAHLDRLLPARDDAA